MSSDPPPQPPKTGYGEASRWAGFGFTVFLVLIGGLLLIWPAGRLITGNLSAIKSVELMCLGGGVLMVALGFYLTVAEQEIRDKIKEAVQQTNETVKNTTEAVVAGAQKNGKPAVSPEIQSAAGNVAASYVTSLGDLAKNLTGLSKAVAAFLVATILFFFAAGLAGVGHSVTSSEATPSPTPTASPATTPAASAGPSPGLPNTGLP